MLTLTMRTGSLPLVARDQLAGFVAKLPPSFEPVLKAAVDVQAKAFGLPPQRPRFAPEPLFGGVSRDRVFVEVLATERGVITLDVATAARRLGSAPDGPTS